MSGVLYISYDGILEPLGQSQVLSYLEKLSPGRTIHLISFEKPHDWANEALHKGIARRAAAAGVKWHPLRYHRSPTAPATAYDIGMGSLRALAIARRHKVSIVHARSYVAGLMGLVVKSAGSAKLLFDMRGLWPDEKVDFGTWTAHGHLYRAAKTAERRLLLKSDHIVTLTHASRDELLRWPYLQDSQVPITVIPTCVDLDRFTVAGPLRSEPFVLGYVGSVGGVYLLEDMLRCVQLLRETMPDARLLLVNRGEHELVRSRCGELGLTDAVDIVASEHRDIPKHIGRMSAGLALYKTAYSRLACAPTKLGEYLACGVPCIGSAGVGDVAEVLSTRRVGTLVADRSEAELRRAVQGMVQLVQEGDVQRRCRRAAEELFSLERGAAAYASIYRQLSPS